MDEDRPEKGRLMEGTARIKVSRNGPYLVSGSIPLIEMAIGADGADFPYEWRPGRVWHAREHYRLCRCGQSQSKPFCDGTHLKINFACDETASRRRYLEQAEEIKGRALTLTDAPGLCAHARFCDRAGGIWNLTRQSDEPNARRIAIEEASDCPSGRLVVWDEEGRAIEPQLEPSIVVVEDPQKGVGGQLWVRGGIVIEAPDGFIYELRNRVSLCRCGKSRNKALCDGSHLEGR